MIQDREDTKDPRKRIVLHVYKKKVKVKDEWANLESVE